MHSAPTNNTVASGCCGRLLCTTQQRLHSPLVTIKTVLIVTTCLQTSSIESLDDTTVLQLGTTDAATLVDHCIAKHIIQATCCCIVAHGTVQKSAKCTRQPQQLSMQHTLGYLPCRGSIVLNVQLAASDRDFMSATKASLNNFTLPSLSFNWSWAASASAQDSMAAEKGGSRREQQRQQEPTRFSANPLNNRQPLSSGSKDANYYGEQTVTSALAYGECKL